MLFLLLGLSHTFSFQATPPFNLRLPFSVFFRVQPSLLIARLIVQRLTRSPWACSHMAQCCSSIASPYACNWGSTPASTCARFFGGRPGIALGRTCPSSRRCFRYRLIVALETPKNRTISARGRPRSTARKTRSRKSCEYAFMNFLLAKGSADWEMKPRLEDACHLFPRSHCKKTGQK